jgi:hypothetical protein
VTIIIANFTITNNGTPFALQTTAKIIKVFVANLNSIPYQYLVMKAVLLNKAESLEQRDLALAKAREARMQWGRSRASARKTYGDAGGLNPTPISGGLCDHWPEETKDFVRNWIIEKQDQIDLALQYHKQAGKRSSTFRVLLENSHLV